MEKAMSAKKAGDCEISLPDLQKISQGDNRIPWKHGGYKVRYNVTCFFKNPFKKPKRELNLLEQVEVLINTGDAGSVIDYCEKYIYLHRIVENTRARRRLERWITLLIAIYLLAVFSLIATAYVLNWNLHLGVVVTILSTTTVNIVALGYILVRGLFHEHEANDIKKEKPKTKHEEPPF